MNGKWNSDQRHKFLRSEASRDILKLRVSRALQEVFVVSSQYTQDWEKCCRNIPGIPQHCQFKCFTDLNLFTSKYGFNVIRINWEMDA